jgi:regulator of cell morphogenesis and NO signaling
MQSTTSRIDAAMTVNEVIRRHPATLPIFNEYGIDTCCGGGVALAVAAERDAVDLGTLLLRLQQASERA